MEFSIHQDEEEGEETQQASEGGSAAQMSPIPSEIENQKNKSTPSDTPYKPIPPMPKKRGKWIV